MGSRHGGGGLSSGMRSPGHPLCRGLLAASREAGIEDNPKTITLLSNYCFSIVNRYHRTATYHQKIAEMGFEVYLLERY